MERVVQILESRFPFIRPVDLPSEKSYELHPDETAACGGRISTLVNPPRNPEWAKSVGASGGTAPVAHQLWFSDPDRRRLWAWRARGPNGLWHPLSGLSFSRTDHPGALLQLSLLEPGWYPRWDCPPLREYELDNWAEVLAAFRDAARDAGPALRSAMVCLGDYGREFPGKSRLVALAHEIPGVILDS